MGMSASQSRLLTLTGRMSDLEYKAQGITNSKLRLSVQTQDVARAYSDALNKEKLSVLTGSNGGTSTYADLDYATLCGADSPLLSQYGLSTSNGAILVSKDIADKFAKSATLNDFLIANGAASTTTTIPKTDATTKTEITDPAAYQIADKELQNYSKVYLGVDGTGTTSGAKFDAAKALTDLDAYGKTHVKGYTTAGAWSYSTTGTTTTPTTVTRGGTTTTTGTTTGTTTTNSGGGRRAPAAPTDPTDPTTFGGSDRSSVRTSTTPTTPTRGTTPTTYTSVANADKIAYTPTGTETEAAVKAKYEELSATYGLKVKAEEIAKTGYDTALAARDAYVKTTVTPGTEGSTTVKAGTNTAYYTNLFARMQDGYATVGASSDEANTLNNAEWIQNQILNHNLTLEKVGSDGTWAKTSISTDTSIVKESDDRDMAKAEADYKVATAEIQTKDKRFDLELQNVETEHTAIQTEVDGVRKVIDKNIDRSFKNFNA